MKKRIGRSKWEKWKCINRASHTADYQPKTAIYSLDQLKKFIADYSIIYVKPDGRSLGKNVIRVSRDGNRYTAQRGKITKTYNELKQFDQWLSSIRGKERYLVQQGIAFAQIDGRPVDLRSIILKNEKGKWEVTGMVAKKAAKGLAITNVARGGELLKIEDYLDKMGMSKEEQEHFFSRFYKLSQQVGEQFGKHYSNYMYGLDIGMDHKGKLWLIEANTYPNNLFLRKFNKKMDERTKQLVKLNSKA